MVMSPKMTKKFVRFFRTVTIPTLSSCNDGKLVHSIPTKMQFAGNQSFAMFQFHGCGWAAAQHAGSGTPLQGQPNPPLHLCNAAYLEMYDSSHSGGLDGQHADGALKYKQHGEQVKVIFAQGQLVEQNHAGRCAAVGQAWHDLHEPDRLSQRRL